MSTTITTETEPRDFTILRVPRDIRHDTQTIRDVHTALHESLKAKNEKLSFDTASVREAIRAEAKAQGRTSDTQAASPIHAIRKKRAQAIHTFASATNLISALLDGKDLGSEEDGRTKAQELSDVSETLLRVGIKHGKLLAEHIPLVISILKGDTTATYSDFTWRTLIPSLYQDDDYRKGVLEREVADHQATANTEAEAGRSVPTTYILDTQNPLRKQWAEVERTYGTWQMNNTILSRVPPVGTEDMRIRRREDMEWLRKKFETSLGVWATSVIRDAANDHSAMKTIGEGISELGSMPVRTRVLRRRSKGRK